MGIIFKLIAVLTTLVTTVLLVFESVKGGMLVLWSILAVVKVIVLVAFCALLGLMLYVLLTSNQNQPPSTE